MPPVGQASGREASVVTRGLDSEAMLGRTSLVHASVRLALRRKFDTGKDSIVTPTTHGECRPHSWGGLTRVCAVGPFSQYAGQAERVDVVWKALAPGTSPPYTNQEGTMTEVVAIFKDRSGAERAVGDLYNRGFDHASVGYLDRRRDADGNVITDPNYVHEDVDDDTGDAGDEAAKGAAGGAAGGAAVGLGTGLLASAGMLLIPGLGPFLAAGTLAGTLGATAAGAAGGAAIGGAAGAIFGASTDDDDDTAAFYRREVEQGSSMLSVEVAGSQADEVADALRDAGAERVDVYGDEGWVV